MDLGCWLMWPSCNVSLLIVGTCVCRLSGTWTHALLCFCCLPTKHSLLLCLTTLFDHHPVCSLFLFLDGAVRAITKALRPGLYNLCGIFDQWCFWMRVASENGLGSAVWALSTNPKTFFFFAGDLAAEECSVCTSGPEKFTKMDHQLFLWIFLFFYFSLYPHPLATCWFLFFF